MSFLADAMVKEWKVEMEVVNKVINGMLNPDKNGHVVKGTFMKFCMAFGPWLGIFKLIKEQFFLNNDVAPWFHGEEQKASSKMTEHGQYLFRYADQQGGLNLTLAEGVIGKVGLSIVDILLTTNCTGGWVTAGQTYFSIQVDIFFVVIWSCVACLSSLTKQQSNQNITSAKPLAFLRHNKHTTTIGIQSSKQPEQRPSGTRGQTWCDCWD